jgi:hypothetical protein
MGMLTGVGIQKEYERNGLKTKMVAIQLDYDGLISHILQLNSQSMTKYFNALKYSLIIYVLFTQIYIFIFIINKFNPIHKNVTRVFFI